MRAKHSKDARQADHAGRTEVKARTDLASATTKQQTWKHQAPTAVAKVRHPVEWSCSASQTSAGML